MIDDARPGGGGRLYVDPVEVVRADDPGDVPGLLASLSGRHGAGFLAYEAGHALEPRLAHLGGGKAPLGWFGLFAGYRALGQGEVADLLPDPAGAWVGTPEPLIPEAGHAEAVERVLGWIAAGDIYQANLTLAARVPFAGDPLALYAAVRGRAGAAHGAVVWTEAEWLLSFSPELFFSIEDGTITARPMKGTARRREDAAEDAEVARALAADEKQRAENLMIVDLMRNDLARIAEPGSVTVERLFAVETFPSIHQMTSGVQARLVPGIGPAEALAALFPCGSVTGAPKIRAMELIGQVEPAPRGAYTGAIGWCDPAGNASFNVAIRTLTIDAGMEEARLGLGSGIVADSRAAAELDECQAKGAFLTLGQRGVDLIETMAFDPEEGLRLLERHLARLKASATRFGIPFDRHDARNELQAATFRLREPRRVRLLLGASGAVAIEIAPPPPPSPGAVEVAVVPLPVDPADFRLRHKTGDRRFYDAARTGFEVVFERPDGLLTEGSFTNLFVRRGGLLLTPPLARGLLPGVLREELLATGQAVERDLTRGDLAGGFLVGNALRGLLPAVLAQNVARNVADANTARL
ncbi:aminodeoxychorismate synthase component I [Sphingomonas aracearum]|uniref:Probable branched-chain-amino-acid aminotransferase n=1 Tax=Sphingomonas aracearum TaxID=2283317 RepID=A0A369W272_9SPHN|nr:aminodeoxychorismate synthase component I [Sphingomonas aracearum]